MQMQNCTIDTYTIHGSKYMGLHIHYHNGQEVFVEGTHDQFVQLIADLQVLLLVQIRNSVRREKIKNQEVE